MTSLLLLLSCESPPPPCRAETPAWEDLDGDGYGGLSLGKVCALEAGQVGQPLDCDDEDAARNPDAKEACNGLDDDCDGEIDQGLNLKQFWQDADGDGFGGAFSSVLACEKPGDDWVRNDLDCDDEDPLTNPDGNEVCGGGDEDCDGLYDDDDDSTDRSTATTFFRDADDDGFGNREESITRCHLRPGFITNDYDCDDEDPEFHFLEMFTDADNDGYGDANTPTYGCQVGSGKVLNGDDCDDSDPNLLDERDWFVDIDGDGWGSGLSQGYGCTPFGPNQVPRTGDCDEADAFENPGVAERCRDGIDQNCNGLIDCQDPDCASLCMPACSDDLLVGTAPFSVSGSTVGQGNDIPECTGASANDYVYWFVPDQSGTYIFDTQGSNYDTALLLKTNCNAGYVGCNDDYYGLQSRLVYNLTAGVGILVVVDGYSINQGSYILNVHF
ncbi:MAG: putative metal-binding motif-containing protein [Alphaproteobacteria bacterium]|nr:putative metal-binding motif-containing protein [Alphaproteobacteria bacterium]